MQPIIELKTILYMLTIEREGGFQKAAESLYISQPALSQYLKRIENGLSFPLYERDKGKCTPTKPGKILLERGKKLLADYTNMVEEMNSSCNIRDVRAGWTTGYTMLLFNQLFSYLSMHTQVSVSITEESVEKLLHLLLDNNLDLIFVPAVYSHPDLVYTTLQHEEFYLAVPKSNPSSAAIKKKEVNGYIDLRIVTNMSFVMIDAKAYTTFFYSLFKKYDKKPNIIFNCKDWGRARILSEQSSCLSILPYWFAKKDQGGIDFYRIKSRQPNFRIFSYVTHKDKIITPGMQTVIDYMKKKYSDEYVGQIIDQDTLRETFHY